MGTNELRTDFIWYNGELIPFHEAKIHILSPTCQFGINVFEGIRGYWNEENEELYCFRLGEHYKRLKESAKILRLDANYSEKELQDALENLLKANQVKEDVAVRQTLILEGNGSWHATGPVGMFISSAPRGRAFEDKKGLSCCVSSWERINESSIPPRVKAGSNYTNSRLAQLEASMNGYDIAIIRNRFGKIAEGPGACIFIVRDNKLITPPVTSDILESITRDTIINLAKDELNLEVEEREIDRTELYIADEAFFCGSAMEIVPITSVDKIDIRDGEAGPITEKLKDLYMKIVRGHNEKYMKWLTPIYKK